MYFWSTSPSHYVWLTVSLLNVVERPGGINYLLGMMSADLDQLNI
jgi:hypothetical protein